MGERMEKIEEIVSQAYDTMVKKKKDESLADTYLSAQVASKQRKLDDLVKEIGLLEAKKAALAETVRRENAALLADIAARRQDAESKHREAQTLMENARREFNEALNEKQHTIGVREQLVHEKQEYERLRSRIKDFASTL